MTGCLLIAAGAGAAAGAGGIAYVRGELVATLSADVRTTAQAVEEAFDEIGYSRISSGVDTSEARLVGRTASDRRVLVQLRRTDSGDSRISIRIGTFGDQDLSMQLLETIKAKL